MIMLQGIGNWIFPALEQKKGICYTFAAIMPEPACIFHIMINRLKTANIPDIHTHLMVCWRHFSRIRSTSVSKGLKSIIRNRRGSFWVRCRRRCENGERAFYNMLLPGIIVHGWTVFMFYCESVNEFVGWKVILRWAIEMHQHLLLDGIFRLILQFFSCWRI